MNCQNCGSILQQNAKFCKRCGTKVISATCQYGDNIANSPYDASSCHNSQYNYSYNYSNKKEPTYNLNASHKDQYDYNYIYSKFNYIPTTTVGDEKYIEAYIGPNYSNIKNNNFSIATLLFGGFYMLYRKMYSLAFIYFILDLLSTILLKDFSKIINFAIRIVMAIKFKKLYLEKVERKVEQIKQSNLDKTSNELLNECQKKGGVSIKSAIIIPIISLIIILFGIIYLELTNKIDLIPKIENQKQTNINRNHQHQ